MFVVGVAPPQQLLSCLAMDHLAAVSVLLLLFSVATAINYDPSPNPEAVVQVGKARFTVLTDHLVRMEWGGANDAATLAFVNRNLPKPKFTTSKDGNWTIIQTSAVEVSLSVKTSHGCDIILKLQWPLNVIYMGSRLTLNAQSLISQCCLIRLSG